MNLVNELQVSAESDDVLTVLRKTRRLASKLDRGDITEWLACERDGYWDKQRVPQYRMIRARPALNLTSIGRGIQDLLHVPFSPEIAFKEPISTVCEFIEENNNDDRRLYFPVESGSEESYYIRRLVRVNPIVENYAGFLLHLNEYQVRAITEQIKDVILDWACGLERAGVTGEGLTFSAKEREVASTVIFNLDGCNIEQLSNTGSNHRGIK